MLHAAIQRDDDENGQAYEAAAASLDAAREGENQCGALRTVRATSRIMLTSSRVGWNKWSWLIPGFIESRIRQLMDIAGKVIPVLDAAINQFCRGRDKGRR